MGMYTHLCLNAELMAEQSSCVIDTLKSMLAGEGQNVGASEHPLFKTDRCTNALTGCYTSQARNYCVAECSCAHGRKRMKYAALLLFMAGCKMSCPPGQHVERSNCHETVTMICSSYGEYGCTMYIPVSGTDCDYSCVGEIFAEVPQ